MQINGYKIKYSEQELAEMMDHKTINIELAGPELEAYKQLSAGNRKALEHLVTAAKMMNNVALEQDNPHNLSMKKALEEAAINSTHAARALELFNSLNGVAGFNGVDKQPIEVFEDLEIFFEFFAFS